MLGVPALAVVAAATDALSYLGLGKVFPANMTGNTVLLGIGIAEIASADSVNGAVLIPLVVLAMVVAASMVVSVHRLPRAEGGE